MKLKEFKEKSLKGVDSWVEVFIFDHIAGPLGCLFYNLFKKVRSLPYVLTFLALAARLVSAGFFFTGYFYLGVIMFFIGYVLDNMDGKVSRVMFGKDPQLRGTLDFLFDMIALPIVYFAIAHHLINIGYSLAANWMIILLAVTMFCMAATSTKFRIYALKGLSPNKPLANIKNKTIVEKKGMLGLLFKLQTKFAKYRINFYPSGVEAEFLAIILFPLFPTHYWLLIVASALFLLDAIGAGILPTFLLIKEEK